MEQYSVMLEFYCEEKKKEIRQANEFGPAKDPHREVVRFTTED